MLGFIAPASPFLHFHQDWPALWVLGVVRATKVGGRKIRFVLDQEGRRSINQGTYPLPSVSTDGTLSGVS
jgi:hypothetical protein